MICIRRPEFGSLIVKREWIFENESKKFAKNQITQYSKSWGVMAQSKPEATCTCPVCRDLFTEPVVIQCGHSFCESCITHWWDLSGQRSCPVCKQLFLGAQPTRNFALKDLCDTLRQERDQNQGTASEEMCSLHDEKRKLFCQVDQELICVICKDSQKHQNHKCAPVCEVAEENRVSKTKQNKTKILLYTHTHALVWHVHFLHRQRSRSNWQSWTADWDHLKKQKSAVIALPAASR